jgi:hypothetical protein
LRVAPFPDNVQARLIQEEMIKDRDVEQREWFLGGEADLERDVNSAGNGGGRPVLWRVVVLQTYAD